jgi:hypothetical protein
MIVTVLFFVEEAWAKGVGEASTGLVTSTVGGPVAVEIAPDNLDAVRIEIIEGSRERGRWKHVLPYSTIGPMPQRGGASGSW